MVEQLSTGTMDCSSSEPALPVEVYEPIVKYLSDDIRSLQNVSLVCRRLRTISQSLLFSSLVFTGEKGPTGRVLSTLEYEHGHILSHIHTLSLIYRLPSMWLEGGDRPSPQLLTLIVKQAKDLRAIQVGPFCFHLYATEHEKDLIDPPSEFDNEAKCRLSIPPESISTLISEVFPRLEEIVLEDVFFVQPDDVRQWRRVKTLQVPLTALVMYSPRSGRDHEDEDRSLPAPTTLAVFRDFYEQPCGWHGYSISFESIKDLRMEIMWDGEYRLFNAIMQGCHHNLESLRLFIFEDPRDQVLPLSGLSSLKSLYLIIYDLANPIAGLSQVLNWLNVCDLTCLEDICLYIHVDNDQREDWSRQVVEGPPRKYHTVFWQAINEKLGEIFEAKMRTRVSLKLPPSKNVSRERVLEYIHGVIPSTKDEDFHLMDTESGSQAIFRPMFTQASEQTLSVIRRKIADECGKTLLRFMKYSRCSKPF